MRESGAIPKQIYVKPDLWRKVKTEAYRRGLSASRYVSWVLAQQKFRGGRPESPKEVGANG